MKVKEKLIIPLLWRNDSLPNQVVRKENKSNEKRCRLQMKNKLRFLMTMLILILAMCSVAQVSFATVGNHRIPLSDCITKGLLTQAEIDKIQAVYGSNVTLQVNYISDDKTWGGNKSALRWTLCSL